MCGVRPNSPMAMTSVESSRPRAARSSIRAAIRWSAGGIKNVLEPVENVLVGVPVSELAVVLTVVDGDEPDSRLDQPTGHTMLCPCLFRP